MPISQMREIKLRQANYHALSFTTDKGQGQGSLSFSSSSQALPLPEQGTFVCA